LAQRVEGVSLRKQTLPQLRVPLDPNSWFQGPLVGDRQFQSGDFAGFLRPKPERLRQVTYPAAPCREQFERHSPPWLAQNPDTTKVPFLRSTAVPKTFRARTARHPQPP